MALFSGGPRSLGWGRRPSLTGVGVALACFGNPNALLSAYQDFLSLFFVVFPGLTKTCCFLSGGRGQTLRMDAS